MGEYAPDDQRTVHNNADGEWQDKQAENASRKNQSPTNDGEAQMGYGNARNENGTSEQAEAEGDLENSLNSERKTARVSAVLARSVLALST